MRLLAVLAATVASPHGFHANGVRCVVGLPMRGLVCASPWLHSWQYDGRGLVQLLPSGRVRLPRAGSDVLLAIDRATAPRLRRGAYGCAPLAGGVACVRHGHGFFLSSRVFRRF